MQAVKTTPHISKPLWYRVPRKTPLPADEKGSIREVREYQKDKRINKETGVPPSNKKEHQAQKL
jgi:hypothetical protein